MWSSINTVIFVFEIVLLLAFALGQFRRKKIINVFAFMALTFVIILSLHIVPYSYNVLVLGKEYNLVLDILECISDTIKHFVGEVRTDNVRDFAKAVPGFTCTFFLGTVLALLATISTAMMVFSRKLRNFIKLSHTLSRNYCDIVVGSSPDSLRYAQQNVNTVLLVNDSSDKDSLVSLMEAGYTVLCRRITPGLFNSRLFNSKTRYNVICTQSDAEFIEYIDAFVTYRSAAHSDKNFYMYVEVDETKAEIIRQEIIVQSGNEKHITTFSKNELVARTFIEKHPVTEFLPGEFYEADTSLKADVSINVFLLGYEKLSREIYRQSVLNNQFVTFKDGRYSVFPVNYHIYSESVDKTEWNISGLEFSLKKLVESAEEYFPLPEMPYKTNCVYKDPGSRLAQHEICDRIKNADSYSYVIIDTGDSYRNIEIGAKMRILLTGADNYHIFIRCDIPIDNKDTHFSYYGDTEDILTHDIIVNDSLSALAKKVNEEYTRIYMSGMASQPDFEQKVAEAAQKSWDGLDYFTAYSNIHLAMNLRVKLNLLGLDYIIDGRGENVEQIKKKFPYSFDVTDMDSYILQSKRNAVLAQEHSRWNAYHLLSEWLPAKKSDVVYQPGNSAPPRFATKDKTAQKHACLTTYNGLRDLSLYLAESACEYTDGKYSALDYDYYINDGLLLTSAERLLPSLGYSITELSI